MKIYKMTNHPLSPEQRAELDGYEIVEPSEVIKSGLLQSPDNEIDIFDLAKAVVEEAAENGCLVILGPGGSPAFMAMLVQIAIAAGLVLRFSHSVREYKETILEDGSVSKTNIFRHVRFIDVPEKNYKII